MQQNILKDCLIVKASNGAGAGTTEVDSSIVDAKDFDAVIWLVDLGTVVDTCVLTAQPQENTANSTSGMADVGTAATHTDAGGASSNTILATEVHRFKKRYHRLKLTRTTANATINTIIGIFFRGKNLPVTLDSSIIASALSVAGD